MDNTNTSKRSAAAETNPNQGSADEQDARAGGPRKKPRVSRLAGLGATSQPASPTQPVAGEAGRSGWWHLGTQATESPPVAPGQEPARKDRLPSTEKILGVASADRERLPSTETVILPSGPSTEVGAEATQPGEDTLPYQAVPPASRNPSVFSPYSATKPSPSPRQGAGRLAGPSVAAASPLPADAPVPEHLPGSQELVLPQGRPITPEPPSPESSTGTPHGPSAAHVADAAQGATPAGAATGPGSAGPAAPPTSPATAAGDDAVPPVARVRSSAGPGLTPAPSLAVGLPGLTAAVAGRLVPTGSTIQLAADVLQALDASLADAAAAVTGTGAAGSAGANGSGVPEAADFAALACAPVLVAASAGASPRAMSGVSDAARNAFAIGGTDVGTTTSANTDTAAPEPMAQQLAATGAAAAVELADAVATAAAAVTAVQEVAAVAAAAQPELAGDIARATEAAVAAVAATVAASPPTSPTAAQMKTAFTTTEPTNTEQPVTVQGLFDELAQPSLVQWAEGRGQRQGGRTTHSPHKGHTTNTTTTIATTLMPTSTAIATAIDQAIETASDKNGAADGGGSGVTTDGGKDVAQGQHGIEGGDGMGEGEGGVATGPASVSALKTPALQTRDPVADFRARSYQLSLQRTSVLSASPPDQLEPTPHTGHTHTASTPTASRQAQPQQPNAAAPAQPQPDRLQMQLPQSPSQLLQSAVIRHTAAGQPPAAATATHAPAETVTETVVTTMATVTVTTDAQLDGLGPLTALLSGADTVPAGAAGAAGTGDAQPEDELPHALDAADMGLGGGYGAAGTLGLLAEPQPGYELPHALDAAGFGLAVGDMAAEGVGVAQPQSPRVTRLSPLSDLLLSGVGQQAAGVSAAATGPSHAPRRLPPFESLFGGTALPHAATTRATPPTHALPGATMPPQLSPRGLAPLTSPGAHTGTGAATAHRLPPLPSLASFMQPFSRQRPVTDTIGTLALTMGVADTDDHGVVVSGQEGTQEGTQIEVEAGADAMVLGSGSSGLEEAPDGVTGEGERPMHPEVEAATRVLFERVRDLVTEQTDSDTEEATEESVVALRDALVSLRQARHTAGVQAREAVLREAMDTITQGVSAFEQTLMARVAQETGTDMATMLNQHTQQLDAAAAKLSTIYDDYTASMNDAMRDYETSYNKMAEYKKEAQAALQRFQAHSEREVTEFNRYCESLMSDTTAKLTKEENKSKKLSPHFLATLGSLLQAD